MELKSLAILYPHDFINYISTNYKSQIFFFLNQNYTSSQKQKNPLHPILAANCLNHLLSTVYFSLFLVENTSYCQAGGRGFESLRPRSLKPHFLIVKMRFFVSFIIIHIPIWDTNLLDTLSILGSQSKKPNPN